MTMMLSGRRYSFPLLFIFSAIWLVALSAELPKRSQKPSPDLTAASSVPANSYKTQSQSPRSAISTGNRGYGYPYAIAPTLTPIINARSDEYENEAIVSKPKPYGSKLSTLEDPLKKSSLKKYKAPFSYEASRRQGLIGDGSESPLARRFRAYKEPKYRNFDELESRFRPRRMDLGEPYGYHYVPKSSRRPPVSPRDPYLSPSSGPADVFYPTVPKVKSYNAPYTHSGPKSLTYGAGRYEEASPYHDDHHYDSYGKDSYGKDSYGKDGYGKDSYDKDSYGKHSYGKDSYGGPPQYPTSGGHYDYQEDYTIESNKPITGDIRKRLLDYAGASDLYEGEPDYLQRVARNKNKYGQVANDYYAYGGPGYRSSYRDFPYVESKVSLLKKQRL